jgi:hypothetical protein
MDAKTFQWMLRFFPEEVTLAIDAQVREEYFSAIKKKDLIPASEIRVRAQIKQTNYDFAYAIAIDDYDVMMMGYDADFSDLGTIRFAVETRVQVTILRRMLRRGKTVQAFSLTRDTAQQVTTAKDLRGRVVVVQWDEWW